MYRVVKTYGHELGLSACFRQWRANSHCRHLHGYALAFTFTFEAADLNECNWVIDFGGLKPLKAWLVEMFDHKLAIALDDPKRHMLLDLADHDLAETLLFAAVGCEAFAKLAADQADHLLRGSGLADRVRLVSVECREHGANAALYLP